VCEFLLTSFLTLFHLHIFSLAEEISNNSPVAVRSCLASLKVQQEAGMPEALNREALNQSICYARKDWPEGLDGELFSSLEWNIVIATTTSAHQTPQVFTHHHPLAAVKAKRSPKFKPYYSE